MKPPLVHVLVINWNGLEHLRECFDSLLRSSYKNVCFVLVDNASTDGSLALVQEQYGHDSRVEIMALAENLGWARGNNEGIKRAMEAGADYVFLLNNDTVTEPAAIEHLVEAAEADSSIGVLAAKMRMYDNPTILNSLGLACSLIASSWDIGIGRVDGPAWEKAQPVIGACGGAAFFRVDALRVAGLLPSDFEIYLDDLDLCLRVWNAGYRVITCPMAVVYHKYSATMGTGPRARRKYYLTTRNRARVILLNYPLRMFAGVSVAYAKGEIRALGRTVLDGEYWKTLAHIRSWFAAAAYLPHAIRERFRRRGRGHNQHAFWRFIRRDCMFFPGMEFPKDGWYAPRCVNGCVVRPMAVKATFVSTGNQLRVMYLNCYPSGGLATVEVRQNGTVVGVLETRDMGETLLNVVPGTVEFVSQRIFTAEETGERVDIGGWLAVS